MEKENKAYAKVHIGEAKFMIEKRIGQHEKDVQYRRENNAVVRHEVEQGHRMD